MKTQSIKLNYKSHKRDFIKTSTVCFAFTAHQEVILIQIELYIYIYQIKYKYCRQNLFVKICDSLFHRKNGLSGDILK